MGVKGRLFLVVWYPGNDRFRWWKSDRCFDDVM